MSLGSTLVMMTLPFHRLPVGGDVDSGSLSVGAVAFMYPFCV